MPTRIRQKTIRKSVSCQGIGVHSGSPVTLTLEPLPTNSGIVVERSDLTAHNLIPVTWDHVVDTRFCTILANEHGVGISTVEHLLAALAIFGITNVLIKVDGPEIPIMDGSSSVFIEMIQKSGIKQQSARARLIKVLKPVEIIENNRWVRLEPAQNLEVDCEVDFHGRQNLTAQQHTYRGGQEEFIDEISNARSFGFFEDAQKLYAMNLAKGSSLENAVVIHEGKVMNPEGLRYENEMVRHKILDAIGDLYLAGYALEGHYLGFNAGHEFNNKILQALFADQTAWAFKDELEEQRALDAHPKLQLFPSRLSPLSASSL